MNIFARRCHIAGTPRVKQKGCRWRRAFMAAWQGAARFIDMQDLEVTA
jgi:hypothetical protein